MVNFCRMGGVVFEQLATDWTIEPDAAPPDIGFLDHWPTGF